MTERVPRILVQGVTHAFDSNRGPLTALSDVDLDVPDGAFVSVIGPSGGGKTTLLRIIGGLLEPTEGAALVDGAAPKEAQRSKTIGFVFQDPSLLPWRTVIGNVRLPLEVNDGKPGPREPAAEEVLAAVGLSDFAHYHPYQLSGGMKQRVALARAMVLNPSVLLMDEPLGALDELTRAVMRYELLRLWDTSRKTVLQVTHSIPEAIVLSDRVLVMSSRPGRIVAEFDIDLERPRSKSVERSSRFLEYSDGITDALALGASIGPSAVRA